MEELSTKKVTVNYNGQEVKGKIVSIVGSDYLSVYRERHTKAIEKFEDTDDKMKYLVQQRLFLMKVIMSKKRLGKDDRMSIKAGIEVLYQMIEELNAKCEIKDESLRSLVDKMLIK